MTLKCLHVSENRPNFVEELLLYEQDPTQDNQDSSAKTFHQYIMLLFTGVNAGSGFVSA